MLVPALLALPLSAYLPRLDLTAWPALIAYGLSQSAGPVGLPIAVLLVIGLIVTRQGLEMEQRSFEAVVMVGLFGLLLGGGALINEHLIKPGFAVPRPDIQELARSRALGMSAAQFYRLPDKPTRSAYLREVLEAPTYTGAPLHPWIRTHWIAETGFSFPSGHSFGSMMFASFFLAMGFSRLRGRRRTLTGLLIPWAVLVCYSRPALRVHSPADITVGGFQGALCGLVLFLAARAILDRSRV